MSFNQGLSGLNVASKNLDVIGNNIANTSTVGFKNSRAEFADVYAASLYGAGSLDSGIGAKGVSVAQQFTQGGFSVTNNPLDVAISGNGFFRLSSNDGVSYTRNGQFHTDKDGYLVANTGENVTGYTTLTLDNNLNVTAASDLGNIKINLDDINATPTSSLNMVVNLDGSATNKTLAQVNAFTATAIPQIYDFSTSVTVFDSLGSDHALTYYFTKYDDGNAATVNTWAVHAYLDGNLPANQLDLGTFDPALGLPAAGAPVYHTLEFNSSGILTPASAATENTSIPILGALNLEIAMDFGATTQYAGGSGINSVSQNGYKSGSLVGLNIEDSGIVFGRYSNGVSQPLQQLVLATFRNPQALIPLGDNQWVATFAAGSETVNKPGEGVAGVLQSGAVEESNTELTQELVNMIVAQRMYQANAQTVKTQDQILQTLVNLR
jgi:flagellar hook protein FlgE